MKYRLLWGGAILGLLLHTAGLGVDVYLHSRDSRLAEREGIFAISNPGHALILAGMGLTAAALLGVAVAWTHDRRWGARGPIAVVLRVLSVPVVGAAATGAIWLASLTDDAHAGDVHQADAAGPHDNGVSALITHEDDHAPGTDAGQLAMASENAHFHGQEVTVAAAQLAGAAGFAAAVRSATEKYQDIRVAMADGYFQLTQDLPGIAAHFLNGKYNADGLLMDPGRPEILLYTKRLDGTWRLVGAMFSSEKVTPEPPSFFGPLDVWHRHENLCFTPNAVSVKENAAECPGIFVKDTPWNLHVWTLADAPGVFAHDLPAISPGAFPGAVLPAAMEFVARAP